MTARLALLLPLLALGCAGPGDDGDGGADLGPLLPLDVPTVDARVRALDAVLPGCTSTDAAPIARRAGTGATGDCGGEVVVDWDHGDGDTAYVVDFQSFCVSGGGDPVVIDGVVEGFEDGTPSDDGPVIASVEVSIPDVLVVEHSAGTLEARLDRLRSEFGLPAAWQPDTPTAEAPDRTTVDGLDFTFPAGDHPDMTLTQVEVQRVGAVPELTVLDGAVVLGDEGHVRIRTADGAPVTADGLEGLTGAVEIHGADDAVLTITVGEGGPLTFDGEVDGAPLGVGMDCTDALAPGLQIYAALFGALPLY